MIQPQAAIHLPLGKRVLAVELFDLNTNSKVATYHREGSRCTFTNEIPHGQFRLVFRLDWGDLDNGEPMLDMDVWRELEDGSLRRVPPKKNLSHHTGLSPLAEGTGTRLYDIEYEGLSLRLVAKKTFAISVGLSICIVDSNSKPEN
jgi:hypothetical protein